MPVALEIDILGLLDSALALKGRAQSFTRETPLLGALPELDSMAVLTVITMLEERFGLSIHDDEIDGAAFETVGALVDWVTTQLDQA
jgi:acyl carrier protein